MISSSRFPTFKFLLAVRGLYKSKLKLKTKIFYMQKLCNDGVLSATRRLDLKLKYVIFYLNHRNKNRTGRVL